MKETKKFAHTGVEYWNLVEFNSIQEFYEYLEKTPYNETFKRGEKTSKTGTKHWTNTSSYEEAADLMRNGWTIGAQELTAKLKLADTHEVQTVYRNIMDVCGYQAIVPLYLNGVPTNMVNKKTMPVKQRVITINKAVSCSGSVSSETLQKESVKCFQIIKKIEASGIRVNLNLMISTGHVCIKIRLKSSGEKLNVSKLAFPLVHASMFRRMYFKFVEVYPTIPKNYRVGYGRVPLESEFKAMCAKGEILLPTLLKGASENDIVRLSVDELLDKLYTK